MVASGRPYGERTDALPPRGLPAGEALLILRARQRVTLESAKRVEEAKREESSGIGVKRRTLPVLQRPLLSNRRPLPGSGIPVRLGTA
nr:hypothetical protein GCM10017745_85990 [Saccharothrix mutabilis subsp. capreolus]